MRFRGFAMNPWQRDFALVALPALAVLGCAFLPKLLGDSDTYWHLATGRWILDHGRPPLADPFSYTMPGRPWVAHEWLSEVLLALAYAAAGLSGVVLLTAGTTAASLAFIALRVRRRLGPLATFLMLAAVAALLGPSMLARPHALVLPILAVWTAELIEARRGDRLPSLLLLPLMVLWANLHGSYIFGLVLLGPFALEALLAAERPDRVRTALLWTGFGVAAVAAAAITPHGVEGLLFPLQLMSLKSIGSITEWRSVDFSRFPPFEAVLLGAIFAAFWKGVRVPLVRLVLLVFLLHMALAHIRHGMVLGVVGALVLAEPLARAYPPPEGATDPLGRRERGALLAAVAALAAVIAVARLALPLPPQDSPNTPVRALAHVPAALRAQPVLNEYGFGGLLIFEGVRPFIDGRADMYGDDFIHRYQRIVGGDRPAFDQAVRQYGIAWAIIAPQEELALALAKDPGWRRLYADRHAVVFARR